MRLTQHSGRGTKIGPYSPKHNDRNFDLKNADNIDPEKTPGNFYWQRFEVDGKFIGYPDGERETVQKRLKEMGYTLPTFEEIERLTYEKHFRGQYERQMAAYRAKGNKKRLVDFETWRKGKRYVPEEITYQIGKVGESPEDPDARLGCYEDIFRAIKADGRKNGYYIVLDAAIHVDEDGEAHLHVRRVWCYTDDDGVECIGQEESLKRHKVPLPHPGEEVGRNNNRKMTYDKAMRKFMMELAAKHGLELETEPIKGAKHNRSKEKYLMDMAQEMMAKAEARNAELDAREAALKKRELEQITRFGDLEALYGQVRDAAAKTKLGPEVEAMRERVARIAADVTKDAPSSSSDGPGGPGK